MACEILAQRAESRRLMEEAIERLKSGLSAGSVTLKIEPISGALAVVGWEGAARGGLTDACAIRRLSAEGFAPLTQAIAMAELMAGRKANLGTAVHSHDGGHTWGSH